MSAQTGLITIGIYDVYDFREACEESYITIIEKETAFGANDLTYDMRIEFETVAQVFVCGQLFLKKMMEKEKIAKENA